MAADALFPILDSTETSTASVTETLRAALLDGTYKPGARLTEIGLAQSLGVSRTPVRAALQALAGEGLLLHQPHRGFSVRGFDLSDIMDAFDLRALAEGLAARLAAERGLSAADQVTLQQALDEGDALLRDFRPDPAARAAYGRINRTIHATIHGAARSGLLGDVIRLCRIVPQSATHNVVAFEHETVRERHAQHRRIVQAILLRRPREAEQAMTRHVLGVKSALIRHLTGQGGGEAGETQPAGARKRA